jgi:hypothetical protein
MIRGEGVETIEGVTPQEVFDFVLDPAQYTRADTKIRWVTTLGDIPNGMIAREEGTFLGVAKGSVITRYTWQPIRGWWEPSVRQEVAEIARRLRAGERGKGLAAIGSSHRGER